MKRSMCAALVLAVLLCGCESAALSAGETPEQTETVTETEAAAVTLPRPGFEDESQHLDRTGRERVSYTGNVSSVVYVTNAAHLPDYEALQGYDEAYFADRALLVVLETVNSGSVTVDIESVENGVVTLSHAMSGDAGTADMATWLLWTEVEQGLDCTWSVANPALESDGKAY